MRKFLGSFVLLLIILLLMPWGQRLLIHQVPGWVIRDGGFEAPPDQVLSVGELSGYYFAPLDEAPTIFFAHGNSSRQQRQLDRLAPVLAQGYGLYYVTYPGFDQNLTAQTDNALGWTPQLFSEEGGKAALQAHWQAYLDVGGEPETTILAAESLGTAMMPWFTTQLPENEMPQLLVIMAGFDEFSNVAKATTLGLVQQDWLYDAFDNDGVWELLDLPVYVANGDQDWVVSEAHGRAAARRINAPYHFQLYEGYGHLDLPLGQVILDAVAYF